MSAKNEHDDVTGIETTGHEWDGIKELNNPLPRWWLWTFYATIAFSVVYTIAYPAWPLLSASTAGLLGWSSRGNVVAELAAVEESRSALADRLVNTELDAAQQDPELLQFALAGGSSAFKVYCSQCHGAGAAGGGIYPNLVDDDWIWGGSLEDIHLTLRHGIRYAVDFDTRDSIMPAFGVDVAWVFMKKTAPHAMAKQQQAIATSVHRPLMMRSGFTDRHMRKSWRRLPIPDKA